MSESDESKVYRLSEDERRAVRRGLAEMRDGKLASDDDVRTVFERYRGIRWQKP